LEKERTLLGKEHLEPLVDGDLRLVGLHLAEIRVGGEVEGHRVARNDPRIDAAARRGIALEGRSLQKSRAGEGPIRNDLDVASWRAPLNALSVSELTDES